MSPYIDKPLNLDGLLATLKDAACVDIGNGLSVVMGSGRQTKYAPAWKWIVDHGDHSSPHHYSDMIELDGFGRYEICRRSNWDAKKKHYDTLDYGKGHFERFTKRTTEKVNALMLKRVAGWYRFHCGNTDCYQPKPWK